MNTETLLESLESSCAEATITELRTQRDALQAQNDRLCSLVREFPRMILCARLDAKEGRETHYDLVRHQTALSIT